jgi:hypothetical protein
MTRGIFCWLAVVTALAVSPAKAANPAGDVVTKYCVTCHNDRTRTGNLTLEGVDTDHADRSQETLEKVVVKLRSRAMPPPGARRPDNAAYAAAAGGLASALDLAATAHPNGRPAGLHRLNRTEYANAIRDLLGVEIDAAAMLPPDSQPAASIPTPSAVDGAGAPRSLSTAAAEISGLPSATHAAPDGGAIHAVKGNAGEQTWLWQTERLGEDFHSVREASPRHTFRSMARACSRFDWDGPTADVIRGLRYRSDIEIRVDGVRVGRFAIGGADLAAADPDRAEEFSTPPTKLQVRVPLKAGLRQVVATIVKTDRVRPEGLGPARIPIWESRIGCAEFPLAISSLLIDGPYAGRVAPDSPSRRRLFVCHPSTSLRASAVGAADETVCATRILSALARRAYRRPATRDDVQTLVGFYKRGRGTPGSFDAGIRAALERVFVSPDFLFRIEVDPPASARGAAYRLSDVDLASRLSFFLWSSIPDDELLDAAIRGQLHDPDVFERQVRRMLADSRARTALVSSFFGQWLQTRNVWLLTPDVNRKFPWFDDNLRSAFVRETELFLGDQLQADRSVVDLLTAKDTFLNERLAGHYGIDGVFESHFRRVTLADEKRWGCSARRASWR